MNAKTISKTAQLKQEREARKAARIAKKAAEQAELQALRQKAIAAVKTPPPTLGSWGIVRSRAYMKLAEILHYRVSLKTAKAEHVKPFLNQLDRIDTMTIDECAALEQIDSRVALRIAA